MGVIKNMDYNFSEDLHAIRSILNLTQIELAEKIGVEQITISRNERRKSKPSKHLMEQVYQFAFKENIQLNRLSQKK